MIWGGLLPTDSRVGAGSAPQVLPALPGRGRGGKGRCEQGENRPSRASPAVCCPRGPGPVAGRGRHRHPAWSVRRVPAEVSLPSRAGWGGGGGGGGDHGDPLGPARRTWPSMGSRPGDMLPPPALAGGIWIHGWGVPWVGHHPTPAPAATAGPPAAPRSPCAPPPAPSLDHAPFLRTPPPPPDHAFLPQPQPSLSPGPAPFSSPRPAASAPGLRLPSCRGATDGAWPPPAASGPGGEEGVRER